MDRIALGLVKEELERALGIDNVTDDPTELFAYGFESSFRFSPPRIVVKPRNKADVVSIVKIASTHRVPLTPRGAGTSFGAQSLSLHDGILVDFRQMNKIKSIDVGDQLVTCEPGTYYRELNQRLAQVGFTFPPEPGSSDYITVGGMVGNNASGMHAVKYGATKNWVIDLEIVLANGESFHTGSRSLKSSSGYGMNDLFVGSEGTLGLVTEITLKIAPAPKFKQTFMAVFQDIEGAAERAVGILTSGIVPAAMEFCDDLSIGMMKEAMTVPLPQSAFEVGRAMLIVEVDGATSEGVLAEGKIVEKQLQETSLVVQAATTNEERKSLWHARHSLTTLLTKARAGKVLQSQIVDIGIPTSKIPAFLKQVKELIAKPEYFFVVAIYGHIGDGNVHFASAVTPETPSEVDKALKVRDKVTDIVLSMNGTLSAEHGTGWARTAKLADELGYKLEVMRQIKHALDPGNIMNPGPFFEVPVDEQGRPNEFIRTRPFIPVHDTCDTQ